MKYLLLAALLLSSIVGLGANHPACTTTINSCGCTITQGGMYSVGAWLLSTQGLTPDNACISIKANNVNLYTKGYGILGPAYIVGTDGSGTKFDTGIYVEGHNVFIEARPVPSSSISDASVILGWKYGIHSRANNLTADGFGYDVNEVGVFLDHTRHNNITSFEALENDQYGVMIGEGRHNLVNNGTLGGNKQAGIFITDESFKNTVTSVSNNANVSPAYPQAYGIQISKCSTDNTVSNTSMLGDGTDMYDGSSTADNTWQENTFHTANRSYIH